MDDGTAGEFGPWDTSVIPPGNNAGVAGNELCVRNRLYRLEGFCSEMWRDILS